MFLGLFLNKKIFLFSFFLKKEIKYIILKVIDIHLYIFRGYCTTKGLNRYTDLLHQMTLRHDNIP